MGGWTTFGLLVADSLVGVWLLKVEGRRTFGDFRGALQEGRWPGDEVAQGALVLVGGTLLLTPGFFTDAIGFLLLLPPTRRVVAAVLRRRVGQAMPWAPLQAARPRRRGADQGSRSGIDIEVVEVRREQPPATPGVAGEPPGPEEPPGGDHSPTDRA